MKISDELRKWYNSPAGPYDDLRDLADRIDAEMVELPKDADGVPIHIGDTVYLGDERRLDYGSMVCVTEIDIKDDCVVIDCWDGSKHVAYHPDGITRNFPDSLKRIVDDIETFGNEADINDTAVEFLCNIQGRIRELAEKEAER